MNINKTKEYLTNDFLDLNNRIQNSYKTLHNTIDTVYSSITNILLNPTADFHDYKVFYLPSNNLIFAFKQEDIIPEHVFLCPTLSNGIYNRKFIENVTACTNVDINSFLSYHYDTSIYYLDLINYGASIIPASDEQKERIYEFLLVKNENSNKTDHLLNSISTIMNLINDNDEKFTL